MFPNVSRIRVISTRARNSRIISQAFATGVKRTVHLPIDHFRRVKELARAKSCDSTEIIVTYGMLRGQLQVLEWAWENQKEWIYIDNGYINSGHHNGYYSVTWNAFQHTGGGFYERGAERLQNLNLKWEMEDWKKGGKHILVLPPTWVFGDLVGVHFEKWVRNTKSKLEMHTDRPIVVRQKPNSKLPDGTKVPPNKRTLQEDLEGCHAVVSYNSKAAIECVLRGYPVFTPTPCCVSAVALDDISVIETPLYSTRDERLLWLQALAANQYTLDEMRSGLVVRWMQEDRRAEETAFSLRGKPSKHFFT